MAVYSQSDPLIPDILRLHGKWRASHPAAIFESETLDWGQLVRRMDQVAAALHALDLRVGDRVAVMMSNGAPMVETLIGCMAAGVTSVPLNLSVSDEAAAAMIRDSGAKAIICTADQRRRVDESTSLQDATQGLARISTGVSVTWRDYTTWRDMAGKGAAATIPDDTLLNIIYSSGTTGLPKGIAHTQRGRKDWANDLAIALRYHSASKTLITIGLYSNISWVSFLCTLFVGGTLIIEDGFNTARFWDLTDRHKITHTSMVPLQFDRILQDEPPGADGRSMQAMMSAGSPLYPDLKAALLKRFGPTMIELYGLTEGVITTLDPEDADTRLSSVGRPLVGTDLRILDDEDREVPPGDAGEIVATGRIVMPGYWNNDAASLDASWTAPDGSVWLRTGDIGRVDSDGFLYIVDRKKDMILSGGQNVYPQDIEAVLVRHPAVAEAAVIGLPSQKWGETPVALCVVSDGANAEQIKTWCNGEVGRQQRIADLIPVTELPRNPNGKILKRQLRDQYKGQAYD